MKKNSEYFDTSKVKESKELNKLGKKVLFPKKLAEANRILKEIGLPKDLIVP